MPKLTVFLVEDLILYAPLYLAAEMLRREHEPEALEVLFSKVETDEAALKEVLSPLDDGGATIAISSVTDIHPRLNRIQAYPDQFVIWFPLVERPPLAIVSLADKHTQIRARLSGAEPPPVRLSCFREGTTTRWLLGRTQEQVGGNIELIDVDFHWDARHELRKGTIDAAVVLDPWLYEGKEWAMLRWPPSQPFAFSSALSGRTAFKDTRARRLLTRLDARISEATFLIYSTFVPQDSWPALTQKGDRIRESVANPEAITDIVVTAGRGQWDAAQVRSALEWMSQRQIWAFDALGRAMFEADEATVDSARELDLREANEAQATASLLRTIRGPLERLSADQLVLRRMAEDVGEISKALGFASWNAGQDTLSRLCLALAQHVFERPHNPTVENTPQIAKNLGGWLMGERGVGERGDALILAFVKAVSLPKSDKRALVRSLTQFRDIAGPHYRKPRKKEPPEGLDDGKRLEGLYLAKVLSKGWLPAEWVLKLLRAKTKAWLSPFVDLSAHGLTYVKAERDKQMHFLGAFECLLREARVIDGGIGLNSTQLEIRLELAADQRGATGLKRLTDLFNGENPSVKAGELETALRALRAGSAIVKLSPQDRVLGIQVQIPLKRLGLD